MTSRPLPLTFFRERRQAQGSSTVVLRLGSLEIALRGVSKESAAAMEERYEPFIHRDVISKDPLIVEVGLEERDYFLDPPEKPESNPILLECDGRSVMYTGYRLAGTFSIAEGKGLALLARGDYEPEHQAMENFLRAAIAWKAVESGGAMVHATGAVYRGSGFLFYGQSGAGKSTLARCNRRGRVIGDDISLVLPEEHGRLQLVDNPFRGPFFGTDRDRGGYRLAAGFKLVQAELAAVEEINRLQALAELMGNLPFVAGTLRNRPDLFNAVEKAFRETPLLHLHFRMDDTFWDVIEEFGLMGDDRSDGIRS